MPVYRNNYRPGGTDVALADGGTGASLVDPNADRIMFWDDSAGATTWLTPGTGLTITSTTIDASSGGSASTSTTVGGLANSPSDGDIAWIRGGSSPFNFVGLVYDGTYGKWVSINNWFLSSKDATPLTTTSTTYAAPSTANVQRSLTPWAVYDTAGLSWQFRMIVQGHIAGGGATASYALIVLSGDASGAASTQGSDFAEVTTTSTTDVVLDSDWVDLPVGLTPNDFIHPLIRHKTSNAGQANTIAIADVFGRLVAAPS